LKFQCRKTGHIQRDISFLITGNSITDPLFYSCVMNMTGIADITVSLNVHLNKQRDCLETALCYWKRSRPHFRSKFSTSRLLDRDCFLESRITAAWPAFPYLQKRRVRRDDVMKA